MLEIYNKYTGLLNQLPYASDSCSTLTQTDRNVGSANEKKEYDTDMVLALILQKCKQNDMHYSSILVDDGNFKVDPFANPF